MFVLSLVSLIIKDEDSVYGLLLIHHWNFRFLRWFNSARFIFDTYSRINVTIGLDPIKPMNYPIKQITYQA